MLNRKSIYPGTYWAYYSHDDKLHAVEVTAPFERGTVLHAFLPGDAKFHYLHDFRFLQRIEPPKLPKIELEVWPVFKGKDWSHGVQVVVRHIPTRQTLYDTEFLDVKFPWNIANATISQLASRGYKESEIDFAQVHNSYDFGRHRKLSGKLALIIADMNTALKINHAERPNAVDRQIEEERIRKEEEKNK